MINRNEIKALKEKQRIEAWQAKFNERLKKKREKEIKSFQRKLKINEDTPIEIATQKICEFVRRDKDLYKLLLTSEQKQNASLLLAMYEANPKTAFFIEPHNFEKDPEFMFKYTTIKVGEKAISTNFNSATDNFFYAVSNKGYRDLLQNPEFVKRLSERYPNVNMLEVMSKKIANIHSSTYGQDINKFINAVNSLDDETLLSHVSKFGVKALKHIPTTHKNNAELVAKGIDVDGFNSLAFLHRDNIIRNIELIRKAYLREADKTGYEKLCRYIVYNLNPLKTNYYRSHGKVHNYSKYEVEYETIQKEVIESLSDILKLEDISKSKESTTNNIITSEDGDERI